MRTPDFEGDYNRNGTPEKIPADRVHQVEVSEAVDYLEGKGLPEVDRRAVEDADTVRLLEEDEGARITFSWGDDDELPYSLEVDSEDYEVLI